MIVLRQLLDALRFGMQRLLFRSADSVPGDSNGWLRMGKKLRSIDLRELAKKDDMGLAMAWIMASHDLQITAYLSKVNRDNPVEPSCDSAEVHLASFMYLQRLYCSQVSEAIRLIQPTEKSATVLELINRSCDTAEAFSRLQKIENENETKKLLERIRNKGTFHYCDYREVHLPKWLNLFLNKLAKDIGFSQIVEYDDHTFRCLFVDQVFNSVFMNEILGIETSSIDDAKKTNEHMQALVNSIFMIVSDIQCVAGGIVSSIRDDTCTASVD